MRLRRRRDVDASLTSYLDTVEAIVDRYRRVRAQPGHDGLGLGFAIPFWFEGAPEVPAVTSGAGGTLMHDLTNLVQRTFARCSILV